MNELILLKEIFHNMQGLGAMPPPDVGNTALSFLAKAQQATGGSLIPLMASSP